MEYVHASWLTRPNHDQAPVRSFGTGNSLIADIIFGDGDIPSDVISKPANSMVSWQH